MPTGFTSSSATGIATDGVNLCVNGVGFNSHTGRDEALLWTADADTPACDELDFNRDGSMIDPCDIESYLPVFCEGPCTLCGV